VNGCVFCPIVAGAAEASVVHEDERTVAVMDIQPVNRGHLLVIPKRHADPLADLDEADSAALLPVAATAAAALRSSGLRCEGVNLFLADGEVTGQEVLHVHLHVHLHVLPRFRGDGFGLRIESEYVVRTRAELDEAAAAIRGA
jgi:histidine triad (HIT) family protein